jgi:hypothetical protein
MSRNGIGIPRERANEVYMFAALGIGVRYSDADLKAINEKGYALRLARINIDKNHSWKVHSNHH